MLVGYGVIVVQNSAPVKTYGAVMRSKIGKRMREERERLGYNQTDFAALSGASKRSQIDWEKGVSTPNADVLAVLVAIGVDVLYILTGQHTPAPAATPDEAALLDNYRHCPPEGQAALKATSDALAQSTSKKSGQA